MSHQSAHALKTALEFYVEHGVDCALEEEPQNRYKQPEAKPQPPQTLAAALDPAPAPTAQQQTPQQQAAEPAPAEPILGASEARREAVKLAQQAQTLEELQQAIAEFEGIALKKTATNLVFCDGNPKAEIMLVGEAPGADEDRQGKPFVGQSGRLLDRILATIDLSREAEEPDKSVYISNILNWRPPGNRNPSPGEIEASLPFIERHIQLAKPKLLIFCGGIAAKSLLGRTEGVSRLRKTWHDYTPQTAELAQESSDPIPAIATYHPAYLLRTPTQKRAVWRDMLAVQAKRESIG